MKGLLRICLFGMVLLVANRAIANTIKMDFEEFFHHDGAPLATFYSGVKFETTGTGQDWLAADITTYYYDASSWPSGEIWSGWYGEYWVYDYVCAWTGEVSADGKISFDNKDATFVELGYCVGNSSLHLEAYDASDTLLDSDSGPPNRRVTDGNPNGPGTLRVEWDDPNPIAYVLIHDTGNFWVVDNIITDASGVTVPEPTTILLFGLGGFALLRRRCGYRA